MSDLEKSAREAAEGPGVSDAPRNVGSALPGRLGREFRTISHMVALYCHDHHDAVDAGPCPQCVDFLAYAAKRLEKCPYGEDKPTCTNCPVHCYKPAPKAFAAEVMRYAGPRMMKRHPWLALLHVLDGRRRVPHPMELRRRR